MAKKPLEWYDPTAKPTEEWDPVIEARRQQLRLSQQHSVLNAYLLMPNAANRPKAVRWRELNGMVLDLWVRLSGDNLTSLLGSAEEVSDVHIKMAEDLELRWWATQVVAEASEAGTQAVTAAVEARLKKISNQMAFYFSREVEELERMFGL